MDTLSLPLAHKITVFLTPAPNSEPVSQVIAELTLRGPVTILDGGNCFPAYRLMRLLRQRLADPTPAAKRVFVRRAFTCYQMAAMLEGTPGLPQPYLLLDPFASFYDEQIPLPEIRQLLERCLRELVRLSRASPLLVATRPARSAERAFVVEEVCAAAAAIYTTEAPSPPVSQPALF
jgi:hypothetical protein